MSESRRGRRTINPGIKLPVTVYVDKTTGEKVLSISGIPTQSLGDMMVIDDGPVSKVYMVVSVSIVLGSNIGDPLGYSEVKLVPSRMTVMPGEQVIEDSFHSQRPCRGLVSATRMRSRTGPMNSEYEEWIDQYLLIHPYPAGLCGSATIEMNLAFPELKRVGGHVYAVGRTFDHWWLKTENGEVVDPTVAQFINEDFVDYVEWLPGDEVRVGKCMNCGEEIWKQVMDLRGNAPRETFCSEGCMGAFL